MTTSNSLYLDHFTYAFGDGVSEYNGWFLSTSSQVGQTWVVQDQFGRYGQGTVTSAVAAPLVTHGDNPAVPEGKTFVQLSIPNSDDGTKYQSALIATDSAYASLNNVWLDAPLDGAPNHEDFGSGFLASPNQTHHSSYRYAAAATVPVSTLLQGTVSLPAPNGTKSGALPDGSEFRSAQIEAGSSSVSARHFPAETYKHYDVLYYYHAHQAGGWTWNGIAADNGTYGYYNSIYTPGQSHIFDKQLHNVGNFANRGDTEYLGTAVDRADTPDGGGIASLTNYPVGSVLITNDPSLPHDNRGFNILAPPDIGKQVGDIVALFAAPWNVLKVSNPLELGNDVASVALANQGLQDAGGKAYVGTKGLGSEILTVDAILKNPASIKALNAQNQPIGLHVTFQITPGHDATQALADAITTALSTTTLFNYKFTYADGSAYNGTAADNGLFLYGVGFESQTQQQAGGTGTYDITGSAGTTTLAPGTTTIAGYTDSKTHATYAATGGGSDGLGSEFGHVTIGGKPESFGFGTLEAADRGAPGAIAGTPGVPGISAGPGTHSIDGGAGFHFLDLGGMGARSVQFAGFGEGSVTVVAPNQIDMLTHVAEVHFADGSMDFDAGSAVAQITRLYDSAFGRAPDQAGLHAWADALKAGLPLASIADAFAGSGEFAARYGHLDNPTPCTVPPMPTARPAGWRH